MIPTINENVSHNTHITTHDTVEIFLMKKFPGKKNSI